ncbi:MAG: methylmalonyl-CoA mutase family protein [Bacteroidia bacterium]
MEDLFKEFQSPTDADWINQIKKDLKTDDIEQMLTSQTEGIISAIASQNIPASSFNAKSNRIKHHPDFAYANDWEIRADIGTSDLKKSNKRALKLLEHGASSIGFKGFDISNQEELRLIIKGINCEIAAIHFDCGEGTPSMLFMYIDELKRMNADLSKINGSLAWDPLGDFAFKGSFDYSKEESMLLTKALIEASVKELPKFRIITIKGARWHNAGASASQELGLVIALAAEFAVNLEGKVPIDEVFNHMQIQLASGSEFFLEVAKFRAIRILWDMLITGFPAATKHHLWLQSETCLRNKTRFDSYSNLLRCTTESIAAIIGGTDEHLVHPFDYHFKAENDDSQRLALNIQHLLKYESGLDKVSDVSAGSPYIEHLTRELVNQAWAIFLQIEEKGGYTVAVRSGFIQDQIIKNRAKLEDKVRTRIRGLIGINRYANPNELSQGEPEYEKDPLVKLPEIKTLEPYFEAASFESIRRLLTLEKQPHACLLLTGNAKMAKLRAGFASEFFSAGGFGISQTDINVDIVDQLHSENAKKADILILCSSDEEYPQIIDNISKVEKPAKLLFVAGNPNGLDELKLKGVSGFVNRGCDAIKVFHSILETMDV